MGSEALGILGAFLLLHILSTWLIMRWAAGQVRREVGRGLGQLVEMFPPHVRAMLGIEQEERIDV